MGEVAASFFGSEKRREGGAMENWPRAVLRIFGALHILMGIVGIARIGWGCLAYAPEILAPNPRYPYLIPFYYFFTIVGLSCLIFLIAAGLALCRLEKRARWLSNVVLGFELIFFWAEWEAIIVLLPLLGESWKGIEDSFPMAAGVGGFDQIQLLTGYPLIALIAINLAYRRLQTTPSAPPSVSATADIGGRAWPRVLVKASGLLDIIVAIWGANVAVVWYTVVLENKMTFEVTRPSVLAMLRAETILAALCFLLLIPTGAALWRLSRSGLRLSHGLLGFAAAALAVDLFLRRMLSIPAPAWPASERDIGKSIGVLWFMVPLILYLVATSSGVAIAFRKGRVPQTH